MISFGYVNNLILSRKGVFLKVLALNTFNENLPTALFLSFKTLLTLWGMWIKTVLFYNEHLNTIKAVVSNFDKAPS